MTYPTDDIDYHQPDLAHAEEQGEEGSQGTLADFFDSTEEDLLRQPWLRNHGWFILTCLVCFAVTIIWPYYCKQQLKEVSTLEKQITDIRYRSLITTAALIEYERIGNILQELDDHQLPLIPATEPPYLLVDSGQHPVVTPPLAHP